jgi:hypothetical protein
METAFYEVVSRGEKWFVLHDGNEAGPYVTKEAAFEAVVPPISLTIQDGLPVELKIEGGQKAPETP